MYDQLRPAPADFHVFDTTLRDGSQQEGLNLSVADKLAITELLDELGVGFIEGGWPGANPGDTAYFAAMADGAVRLRHAELVAFGFTRRVGMRAADDPLTAALRDSRAPVACVVAKSHDRHVEQALRTTLDENLAMISDTVSHLRAEGQRVFVDCEHFFDGYRENRAYALEVVRTAAGSARPSPTPWPPPPARSASASTPTTTPAAPWRTPSPRSTPARRTCRAP